MECRWQVEKDGSRCDVLRRHWPGIVKHGDITGIDPADLERVDVLCGGDPCPYRSVARSIHGTDSPDLWPEFLRFVRALRPLWVLREHVVSGDADDCWADLCRLGYDAIIVEADGAAVTGQSRPREYLCGVLATAGICPGKVFHESQCPGRHPAAFPEAGPISACLTTNPRRFDSRDNYVLEPERGVRILAPVERERLMGLPDGWTAGLSDWNRAVACGDGLIVDVAEWIGRHLTEKG
jgi:site-specific DNA-cytosine methylase